MKLHEIWVNPPRDEYLDDRTMVFKDAQPVTKIKNLILKKVTQPTDIYYGLFDSSDRLVGYLRLVKVDSDWYQVSLSQLAENYKNQGYGTFLYDYAILNDKISLLSDTHLTPASQKLWKKFASNGHFLVKVFDMQSKQLSDDFSLLTNNARYVYAGLPTGKTINESIHEINSKYGGERYVVWYGPGTSGEGFWNF